MVKDCFSPKKTSYWSLVVVLVYLIINIRVEAGGEHSQKVGMYFS